MSRAIPLCTLMAVAATSATGTTAPTAPPAVEEELAEVTVTAPEPRYVAPTTRDRIGRVWVPVLIDGRGPFRLVLDTGAQRSAVVPDVATQLGVSLQNAAPMRLHGATGTRVVPGIEAGVLEVGDVWLPAGRLPVVVDAFGGADGMLGVEGLQDRRIYINFRADYVDIALSRNRRAAEGFITLPFLESEQPLLTVTARVGRQQVLAVIDTGAQTTVGNEALRQLLRRELSGDTVGEDQIHGATGDTQSGISAPIRSIRLGGLEIRDARITFGDLYVFRLWELTDRPAILVGMDILGLLDTLVIDYRRRELQILPRGE
ncbi:MAG TPA: retroviral-like aspartic protease family protein [Steroidobacteraceae bacterium]|nr:retroviral-like aspartic protease family protein [Steroidobacteraceae bacterium]